MKVNLILWENDPVLKFLVFKLYLRLSISIPIRPDGYSNITATKIVFYDTLFTSVFIQTDVNKWVHVILLGKFYANHLIPWEIDLVFKFFVFKLYSLRLSIQYSYVDQINTPIFIYSIK